MTHILDNEVLAADDVLCVPTLGTITSRSKVEVQPFIYSAPMDRVTGYALTKELVRLGQFAVVCRTLEQSEWQQTLKEFAGHPQVFFAIGLCRSQLKVLIDRLIELGIDRPINIAIDVAHGDMKQAHELAAYLRELGICRFIMSGSICTPAAAVRAKMAGCTHLRVGVGPGSVCSTRLMTGCGYPQLSAVYEIAKHLDDIEIIADGGIRTPGDAVKYLAAGATGVMMGSVLAITLESAGWEHAGWHPLDTSETVSFPLPDPEPIYAKFYRGQASASFMLDNNKSHACPEGTEAEITWQGDRAESIINKYKAGVASACSYLNLDKSKDLGPGTVRMVRITSSAMAEGKPQ